MLQNLVKTSIPVPSPQPVIDILMQVCYHNLMRSSVIRTTITLPADLFEELRREAFEQKKPLSALVRHGAELVLKRKKSTVKPGDSIKHLIGLADRHSKRSKSFLKNYQFNRAKFYEEDLKHRMLVG